MNNHDYWEKLMNNDDHLIELIKRTAFLDPSSSSKIVSPHIENTRTAQDALKDNYDKIVEYVTTLTT